MAKQEKNKEVYHLYPSAKGDLYAKSPSWRRDGSGKFILSKDLSQRELEFLFKEGHTHIIYKVEG